MVGFDCVVVGKSGCVEGVGGVIGVGESDASSLAVVGNSLEGVITRLFFNASITGVSKAGEIGIICTPSVSLIVEVTALL